MLLQQLISGITIGSTYALVAIGYSMVFGVMGLVNFANGNIYMLGGFLTLILYMAMKGHFILAFILSIIIVSLLSYGMDAFGLRRLRIKKSPKMTGIIFTLGVSMIIEDGVRIFFTAETLPYPNMIDFGYFRIGSSNISWSQIIILAVAFIIMGATSLLVYKTKFGKAMLAVSQNAEAAMLMGIDANRVISCTFAISAAIATVSGTMVGMYYQTIDSTIGGTINMKALASSVLGGVGVLPGAMVGGILIGVLEALGASYISAAYRNAIAFIVLILIILVKPAGLFGKKTVEKV